MKPTLTYCTNVHRGETLSEVEFSLERFTVPLKEALAPSPFPRERPFPVGLYLSAASAGELADPARLAAFRDFLAQRGLAIVTLNCFPYGGFHAERVKGDVFRPTWLEPRRVEFTLAAARAGARLAPEGAVLPISTLAGSCKLFDAPSDALARMAENLARVALELDRMRRDSGREVVLCLEPEPFTTLETSEEAVRFFSEELFGGAGRAAFVRLGGEPARAEEALRRHVGICFDTCHQAVEFEQADDALARITAAGIRIGKVQLSSALAVQSPARHPERLAELRRYAEARYLHQACAIRRDGGFERWLDLPEFLERPREELEEVEEVRVHFHVPIDREQLPPLSTTRAFLVAAARSALRRAGPPLFEVETYTFPILPDAPGPDGAIVAALAAELRFAAATLGLPSAQ